MAEHFDIGLAGIAAEAADGDFPVDRGGREPGRSPAPVPFDFDISRAEGLAGFDPESPVGFVIDADAESPEDLEGQVDVRPAFQIGNLKQA